MTATTVPAVTTIPAPNATHLRIATIACSRATDGSRFVRRAFRHLEFYKEVVEWAAVPGSVGRWPQQKGNQLHAVQDRASDL